MNRMFKSKLYFFQAKSQTLRTMNFFIALGAIMILQACSSQKATLSYSEDLTANRPQFNNVDTPVRKPGNDTVIKNVTPSHNVNVKVDGVLDSIDRINLTRKYIDGFTIQIYSGQRREDAMNAKQRMVNEAGDLPSTLQYVQPKFRVTVGSYITRVEAQRDLVRLKQYFASAILVPERILLK
jgi:SPOR domain